MKATLRLATRRFVLDKITSASRSSALRFSLFSSEATATAIDAVTPSASAPSPSAPLPTPCTSSSSLPPPSSSAAEKMRPGKRPVSETHLISMADRLEQFQASSEQKLTFESGLNNHERAVIHAQCKKMGLRSKSYGKGAARCITVFKVEGSSKANQSVVTSLSFSPEAQAAIQQLFSSYPPTADDACWKLDDMPVSEQHRANSRRPKLRALFGPTDDSTPAIGETDIANQVKMLGARLRNMPSLQQISQERAKLPIAKFKDEITSSIEKNQVVLIAGETGCGKTTQVPQFILDSMWSQGKSCRVLCTQPRRISAISVADRIATERGEPVGETVGYQIKLESKGGDHSSIMFCTNGVLLRKLVDADIEHASVTLDATHIVVDEIHERDRYADFMLIALRDLLSSRPDLRLVLMSATLDAELFSGYFKNCPVIRIPGFTYPVQTFYLEDVIVATEIGEDFVTRGGDDDVDVGFSMDEDDIAEMDEAISMAWLEDDFELLMDILSRSRSQSVCNHQHSLTGATALMVAAGKGKADLALMLLSRGADADSRSQDGSTAFDWADKAKQQELKDLLLKQKESKKDDSSFALKKAQLLETYLSSIDQEEIDIELIERLLHKICTTTMAGIPSDQYGSVLVFLTGWEDITRARERLQASPLFGDVTKFLLLPLHSMIPSLEQKKVFQNPPPRVRKIVLATNIAETAITINDVVFVIDSGRMKEKSYDPYNNVSTLQTAWISKASARQREGRAGRCRPGVCYHLYSKARASSLPDFQVPEIKRTSLEDLCLQVKLLDSSYSINDFLAKAVDPPNELSIRNAINILCDIGALTSTEKLTELGKQLGSLPVHPSTSKMLLLGILLNCLDPALTIACAAGYRDPFVVPTVLNQRKRAFAAKKELASELGGYSDHLAIVVAFDRWERAKVNGSERRFCEQYFVSGGTMAMLAGMRQQLQKQLAQKGFIPHERHACSLNSHDPGIVRALLVAGLYPMVGTLLPPIRNKQKSVVQTAQGMKVRIHPHSGNFHLSSHDTRQETLNRPLLMFDEVTRGEAWMYIRNCTLVKPHPLLLLAIEMVVAPLDGNRNGVEKEDGTSGSSDDDEDKAKEQEEEDLMSDPNRLLAVVVDRWLKFEATAVEAAQLYCLRERLAAAISFKIRNPRKLLPPVLGNSVFAIACLLSYDGALEGQNTTENQDTARRKINSPRRTIKQDHVGSRRIQLATKKHGVTAHFIKRQRGNNFG